MSTDAKAVVVVVHRAGDRSGVATAVCHNRPVVRVVVEVVQVVPSSDTKMLVSKSEEDVYPPTV